MFEDIIPELTGEVPTVTREVTPIKGEKRRVCFVDGGNGCVFESATARVEFIRIYGVIYNGKSRQEQRKEENTILIKREKGRIVVQGGLSIEIPENDPELRLGKEQVALGTVASLARYILECRFLGTFGKGCDLLVRDGSVVANNGYEERELDHLPKNLCGLSKTNSLPISAEAPGTWVAPIEERDGVRIGLVKLHERSTYLFRLDALELEQPAAALMTTAGDAAFPGYPYPLIEADRLGRVSNQELEGLRLRFKAEAGEAWKRLERLQHARDAHGVLDSM